MYLKLKGCPKCSGDLILIHDIYGRYLHCAQGAHDYEIKAEKPTYTPSGMDVQIPLNFQKKAA
jgi:hypothetical protein